MRPALLQRLCVLLTVAVAGCSGASVVQETQNQPPSATPPSQIAVYPFAVSPSSVTLGQAIGQRIYRKISGANQAAEQLQLAHDIAEAVCQQVASGLRGKGYTAICEKRDTQLAGDNVLIVDGKFKDISEGNRLRRMVVGFGAGASVLDTDVHLYQRSVDANGQLMEFSTHADSGKMPGVLVTGAPGAAIGGAAAVASVGANVAAAGAKTKRSAMSFLADKTSEQIVDQITQYFARQAWSPN